MPCTAPGGSMITSSGFFSLYHPRPAYQEAAVRSWLEPGECQTESFGGDHTRHHHHPHFEHSFTFIESHDM